MKEPTSNVNVFVYPHKNIDVNIIHDPEQNATFIRLVNLSEIEFNQLMWLLDQLQKFGLNTLEDAIRQHLESRYWNV